MPARALLPALPPTPSIVGHQIFDVNEELSLIDKATLAPASA